MPSPFPGMDPYLEDPWLWPGFHSKFANVLQEALNEQILPDYVANIEERVYISDGNDTGRRQIIPDIRIVPTGRRTGRIRSKPADDGGVMVCEPIEVEIPLEDEIHEPYVKIYERHSRRVVTVIEILSPTNKEPGSRGREQYTAKRTETLESMTHWVEIDLLRLGEPILPRGQFPPCQYTVLVSKQRKGKPPRSRLWPIEIVQKLPAIPIPLNDPDPDVMLDLQEVFTTTYDRGSYSYKLDYGKDPSPTLPATLSRWSNKLLKQKKLR